MRTTPSSSSRARNITLAITATALLTLTACTTPDPTGPITLAESPDTTTYQWLSGANYDTLDGNQGTWTRGDSGYTNEELGCLITPTLLESPPEMGAQDDVETENLLIGVQPEVENWKDGEPLLVQPEGGTRPLEMATATYQKTGDGTKENVFLAARYLAQTGQILMLITSCDSPEAYQFVMEPAGLEAAGFSLAVGPSSQS